MRTTGSSVVPALARRFLMSRTSDGFISFIAWVSVAGVALGVLALVAVTSVINGFEGELSRVITGMYGDVILYSRADPVPQPELIEEKIRRALPETEAISPSLITELMAVGPQGVAGAILEGIDSETLGLVTQVPQRLVKGRLPVTEGEVAVGQALADRIGAEEGTSLRLVIPFAEAGDGQGDDARQAAPKALQVRVVGVFRMGMHDYDSKYVFAALPAVQGFLNQPSKVNYFKIRLKPRSDSRAAADRLAEHFGYPFRAKDWAALNKNLFYAVKLEKAVIAVILTAIILVAAFNVVSTLMMMIHDKTRQIAILKAMGFRPGQSFRLFCLIGVGMGAVGTALGVALGLGSNWVLERTRVINLPAEIYYISGWPVVVEWAEVAMIAGLAVAIAFIATLYPAWKVARRSPLEGLRYE